MGCRPKGELALSSTLNYVRDRCLAAYLGDIALTEDELELIGGAVMSRTNSKKPSATPKPPPPRPVPLHRPRDLGALEWRSQERRLRWRWRRKHWRMASSSDMVGSARIDNGSKLSPPEQRKLKRRRNRHHQRQSAEHSQLKR